MSSPRRYLLLLFAACCVSPSAISAKVVRIEIENRQQVAEGRHFGRSGAYEKITGKIYLEVDPDNPANQLIVDLDLAPRNGRGQVEFSTDFELHKPVDPTRGNRRFIYFVNNRGNKISVRNTFHAGGGENWLYRRGWSFLWCGWSCDVIVRPNRMNVYVPVARENGRTVTGKVSNFGFSCPIRRVRGKYL